jgi:hypothetical protein
MEHVLREDRDHSLTPASLAEHDTGSSRGVTAPHGHRVAETAQTNECVASIIAGMDEADARRRMVTHVIEDTVAESQAKHRATVPDGHVRPSVAVNPVRIKTDVALIGEGQQIYSDECGVTHRTPLIDRVRRS